MAINLGISKSFGHLLHSTSSLVIARIGIGLRMSISLTLEFASGQCLVYLVYKVWRLLPVAESFRPGGWVSEESRWRSEKAAVSNNKTDKLK